MRGSVFVIERHLMSLEKFIADFEEAVEDVAAGTLSADVEFKALKSWDSLAVLTVTDSIEMEYGVLLKRDDFMSNESLTDLYKVVRKKGGR
jgi:acyl carrier protein